LLAMVKTDVTSAIHRYCEPVVEFLAVIAAVDRIKRFFRFVDFGERQDFEDLRRFNVIGITDHTNAVILGAPGVDLLSDRLDCAVRYFLPGHRVLALPLGQLIDCSKYRLVSVSATQM